MIEVIVDRLLEEPDPIKETDLEVESIHIGQLPSSTGFSPQVMLAIRIKVPLLSVKELDKEIKIPITKESRVFQYSKGHVFIMRPLDYFRANLIFCGPQSLLIFTRAFIDQHDFGLALYLPLTPWYLENKVFRDQIQNRLKQGSDKILSLKRELARHPLTGQELIQFFDNNVRQLKRGDPVIYPVKGGMILNIS